MKHTKKPTAAGNEVPSWSRCDECGQWIVLADYERGARRVLLTPDSHCSREEYETLCLTCVYEAKP